MSYLEWNLDQGQIIIENLTWVLKTSLILYFDRQIDSQGTNYKAETKTDQILNWRSEYLDSQFKSAVTISKVMFEFSIQILNVDIQNIDSKCSDSRFKSALSPNLAVELVRPGYRCIWVNLRKTSF